MHFVWKNNTRVLEYGLKYSVLINRQTSCLKNILEFEYKEKYILQDIESIADTLSHIYSGNRHRTTWYRQNYALEYNNDDLERLYQLQNSIPQHLERKYRAYIKYRTISVRKTLLKDTIIRHLHSTKARIICRDRKTILWMEGESTMSTRQWFDMLGTVIELYNLYSESQTLENTPQQNV